MTKSRRARTLVAAGLLSSVLVGCDSRGGEQAPPVGISGAPYEVEAEPALSLGVVGGDTLQEFHRVVTPFLMPDGNLVVPLSGAGTIRVFDPAGGLVRSLGRPGAGPGEFTFLTSAWPRGDTIEALDFRLRRITRFLPDGSTQEVPLSTEQRDVAIGGALDDGWAIGGVAAGGVGRDEVGVRHIAADGTDRGVIATVAGMVRYHAEGIGGGPEPFSPMTIIAIADGEVYTADALVAEVRAVRPADGQARTYAWTADPAPADAALLRAVVDSAVADVPSDRAAATRRRVEAAPEPTQLPLMRSLLVDDEGFLWIQEYDPFRHAIVGMLGARTNGGRWRILSPAGEEAGFVVMPEELEPYQITADAVVGIARDSLGVESVRVHTLRRR
jgi:hypothetical protein